MSLIDVICSWGYQVLKWTYWYYDNENSIKPALVWVKHKIN